MISNFELHNNVVKWVAAKTGITVILARQGAARPALPYIMVNFTGFDTTNYHPSEIEFEDVMVGADERVKATPVQDGEWRYSLHAYCGSDSEPEDLLMPLHAYCRIPQAIEPLLPDFVVSDVSQVRSVPEFIQNVWEPRAQMDLFLRGVARYGHIIDVIETVEYDINVERAV